MYYLGCSILMLQAKITTKALHNIKIFREKDIKKLRKMVFCFTRFRRALLFFWDKMGYYNPNNR